MLRRMAKWAGLVCVLVASVAVGSSVRAIDVISKAVGDLGLLKLNDVKNVVNTDNPNPCDPNDTLVQKYKNNLIQLIDRDLNEVTGTGFLLSDCSRLVTVAHTLYDADTFQVARANLDYESYSGSSGWVRTKLPRNAKKTEGDWKETGRAAGQFAMLFGPRIKGCATVETIEGLTAVRFKNFSASDSKLAILKYDAKQKRMCAQRCNILAIHVDPNGEFANTIGHDCGTVGGNSGSPMFVEGKSGTIYLVGMHVGANLNEHQHNIFIPLKSEDLRP